MASLDCATATFLASPRGRQRSRAAPSGRAADIAQVDGSFEIEPLVRPVLDAPGASVGTEIRIGSKLSDPHLSNLRGRPSCYVSPG